MQGERDTFVDELGDFLAIDEGERGSNPAQKFLNKELCTSNAHNKTLQIGC